MRKGQIERKKKKRWTRCRIRMDETKTRNEKHEERKRRQKICKVRKKRKNI